MAKTTAEPPAPAPVVPAQALPPLVAPRSLLPFGEPGVGQRFACAIFAWSVTVAPFAISRSSTWPARALAVLSLIAGISGPLIVPARRLIGRHVGISAFLALTTGMWVLSSSVLAVERLDPVLATIGGIAWGVFAFSWGEPWRMSSDAQVDELGGMLRARAELPRLAVPVAAVGVVSALVLMVLAWRVRESSHALFAQAAGIGLGVAIVTAAAQIAINRGRPRTAHSTLPRPARRAVFVLVLFAVLGGALLVLRGGTTP